MGDHCPQVIINRLESKPWEVIEISALGYLKGIGDEILSLCIGGRVPIVGSLMLTSSHQV